MQKYLLLYLSLLIYSLSFVCYQYISLSKWFYLLALGALGIYALLWQQIIKEFSLITAYANKGVTVLYSMLWGKLLFHEAITWNRVLGVVLIIFGMIFVAKGEGEL
ncbi:MAG: transporter [Clostridiales bacterium]|nr:transporter [Clostridiales bacterium]